MVADDADTITARIIEIRKEAQPRCPQAPSKLLYNCLREHAQCPPQCPFVNDWIGPKW